MSLTLVIGGTRSGKSAHAERLALAIGGDAVRYIATADPGDGSMAERIAAHRTRRPGSWETVVADDDLAATLDDRPAAVTLLDGLGAWLGGVLHRDRVDASSEIDRLIAATRAREVIVVAEEAGQGMLPLDPLSRRWLDALGEATQRLAAAAFRVDYVVAGRVVAVKDPGMSRFSETPNGIALRFHGDRHVRSSDADHAVNVIAGGPPTWLREVLADALHRDASRYPDDAEARRATATRHGRAPEEVVVTNGASEALWLLGPALRPRLAACVHPGFTEAEVGLRAHGIPVVRVLRDPAADFRLDPSTVPDEADLVVLGNPGYGIDPAHAILAMRRPGRVVVVDEAFMDMVTGEAGSLAGEPLADVVVVRSLTKLLSVPGLRVGYALAPPALARALTAVRPAWSANALALATLTAAPDHPQELAALADRVMAERDDLAARLAAIDGIRVWPSPANFVLVKVANGPAVVEALRAERIAVRPAGSFPGLEPGHLRITARDPEANGRVADALAAAVS